MDMDHLKLCLIFAIMLAVTNAGSECQYSLDGNIETISFTGKNISNYQEVEMLQEGDILFIKSLTVTNTGNCTLTNISIEIWLETPSGDKFYFCTTPFKLDLLEPKQMYSFTTNNPYHLEKGVLTCGYRLIETGAHYMKSDVSADVNFGSTVRLNGESYGEDSRILIVQPITELKNLEMFEGMLQEAKNSTCVAIFALFCTVLLGTAALWFSKISSDSQLKALIQVKSSIETTNEKQIKRLDKVAKHIETATDKQLQATERRELKEFLGIIQTVLTEMDLNDEFIKRLKEKEELFKNDETMMIIAYFSTFSLDRLIAKGHLFDSQGIVKNLHYYRVVLSGLNSCLQDIRSSSKIPHKNAINLIFDKYLVDDNIKSNKKLRDDLEDYEKKLNDYLKPS